MIKLFISQPMKGKTDDEILAERDRVKNLVAEVFEEDIEVIDSFFRGEADKPLAMLGKSIQLMAEADMVFFARGWEDARGCRIEHAAAEAYELEMGVEHNIEKNPELQEMVQKAREKIADLMENGNE